MSLFSIKLSNVSSRVSQRKEEEHQKESVWKETERKFESLRNEGKGKSGWERWEWGWSFVSFVKIFGNVKYFEGLILWGRNTYCLQPTQPRLARGRYNSWTWVRGIWGGNWA
ncbi:hypothetical protein MAR_ORF388 [Marseillevirus marseillevirus]|uniref:Uncharacterized protein n=1 Tax=Marseillevirus marseillevirus TaxID=694581 RepID=D2XB24_GBMV|nr:hypothetical protein MAR_ORF388 [Marseillevirus marseillevirus]ADB04151.1 hypothetical protein MAR_ORF388 [Marseillevirus marseillevirus]